MSIKIELNEEEANSLHDVLSNWIDQFEDGRLQDCETAPEMAELWMPMYKAACRAYELIEAETVEKMIEGEG